MAKQAALSQRDQILEAADQFFFIAESLHRRLTSGVAFAEGAQASRDLYSLLVEEYGLRARAAILRNDADAHTVENSTIDQDTILSILNQASQVIGQSVNLSELRSVVAHVSTLCVGINTRKGTLVDTLVTELRLELQSSD